MPGGARALAALRIAVAACWLVAAWRIVPAWADLPALSHPLGTGWIEALADARLAAAGRIVALLAALALLFGIRTRWAAAVLAVLGLYLLGLAQLRGPVQHTHHLVWFTALLAFDGGQDVPGHTSDPTPTLSRRALLPGSGRPRSHLWPLWTAWALLACIYFFPGLHKLLSQGPGWAGEHLRLTLYWKWAQAWDFIPLTRIDRHPTLLWLGGLGVLAFELGTPLLLWNRWTRLVFAVLALGFHTATALWMDIHFWHLAPLLVVLLPLQDPASAADSAASHIRTPPSDAPDPPLPWAALIGAVLLLGAVAAGLTKQTQAWPFACYPTFDRTIGPWMPTLVVRLQPSGELLPEHALADPHLSQAFYANAWAVAGHYGVEDPAAAERFWHRVRRRPAVAERLQGVTRVEVLSAWRHVDPDEPHVRLQQSLWAGPP